MLEINKIYCGDCLKIMKELPDKSIDLILTDPPYGINENNKKRTQRGNLANPINYGEFTWDKKRVSKDYFTEMFRVSKNQIIFGGNYYTDYNLPRSSCWLIWDKVNETKHFSDCELAWTSFKTAVRKFTWRWDGFLQEDMKHKEKRVHPTQKPLALFEWCVYKYSDEGNLILDPFIGSGTTAVACIRTKRNFIGIDKEPKYVDIANKRIYYALQQYKLDL